MNDKILILDPLTKCKLDENPSCKDLLCINDCEVLLASDIAKDASLGSLIVGDGKKNKLANIIKDGKETFFNHLVKSPILQNTYYEIQTFGKCYNRDLKYIIIMLLQKMGARNIEFDFCEEKRAAAEQSGDQVHGVNINANVSASAEYKSSKRSVDSGSENRRSEFSHKDMNFKTSAKEFAKFIKKEGIITEALPTYFRTLVKHYVDDKEITGVIEKIEEIQTDIKSISDYACDISANLGVEKIPNFVVSSSLQSQIKKSYSRSESYYKKIHYRIEF